MTDENTSIEVLPRQRAKMTKKREHEQLLDEIRQHVEVPDEYHPIVSMAVIANNQRLPLSLQLKAHSEVASFLFRKLKPADAPPANAGEVPELRLTLRTKPSK